MSTSTFRTAVVRTPGGPDSIEIIDVPDVEPGAAEVLVRVAAAPVNPVDLGVAGGFFHELGLIDQPEHTGLGWDFAGTVVAAGPGVDLAVGTRVAGLVAGFDRDFGTYAEQLRRAGRRPRCRARRLDLVTASTVPLNGLAAAQIVDLLGDAPAGRQPAAGHRGGRRGRRLRRLARAGPRLAGDRSGPSRGRGVRPQPRRRLHRARRAGLGRRRRRRGAAGTGPRPGPRRREVRRRSAERRAGRRSAGSPSPSWKPIPTHLAWANCSPAPRPASCRPECTRWCRWTRSPTPTGRWPRAECAAATCSSPDPDVPV